MYSVKIILTRKMNTFSKFISIVIHPIFIPLYAFFCYMNIGHFSILNFLGKKKPPWEVLHRFIT